MIALSIQAELGLIEHTVAYDLAITTIRSIDANWPRNSISGFFNHWCHSNFVGAGEFSTIDSAIMVAGALFAGNYFGGGMKIEAEKLFATPNWGDTIGSSDVVDIWMVSNANGGYSAPTHMFNEYAILGAMAKRAENIDIRKVIFNFQTLKSKSTTSLNKEINFLEFFSYFLSI